jgi:hypothetical protein
MFFQFICTDCILTLLALVDAFIVDGGDCSFLHEHYHTLESRLCSEALPAMLWVGL